MNFSRITSICALVCAAGLSEALPRYSVTDLGLYGSGQLAVNDFGQVVGNFAGGNSLYSNGVTTRLNFNVTGINDSGQMSGTMKYEGTYWPGDDHACLYDGTRLVDVNRVSGNWNNIYPVHSEGIAINNSGVVAAWQAYYNTYTYSKGVYTVLGDSAERGDVPIAINDKGWVLGESWGGSQNWAYHDGAFQYLPLGRANGLNNLGEIVGNAAETGGNTQAAIYLAATNETKKLGFLPGTDTSLADAINDAGIVVGYSYSSSTNKGTSFIYDSKAANPTLVNFNDVVDSGGVAWDALGASAISNSGYMVGTGMLNGQTHAVLFTPLPVPEPNAMWAVGLSGLAFLGRKRKR